MLSIFVYAYMLLIWFTYFCSLHTYKCCVTDVCLSYLIDDLLSAVTQFSMPAWRYPHCHMTTSCLGRRVDISDQSGVMVNTATCFVVRLPITTIATAAITMTTSWIPC